MAKKLITMTNVAGKDPKTAADEIWKAYQQAQKTGKPVIKTKTV